MAREGGETEITSELGQRRFETHISNLLSPLTPRPTHLPVPGVQLYLLYLLLGNDKKSLKHTEVFFITFSALFDSLKWSEIIVSHAFGVTSHSKWYTELFTAIQTPILFDFSFPLCRSSMGDQPQLSYCFIFLSKPTLPPSTTRNFQ